MDAGIWSRTARRVLGAGLVAVVPLALTAPAVAAGTGAPGVATVSRPAALSDAQPAPPGGNETVQPAFDETTQELTGSPTTQDPETCISRTIGLLQGTYIVQQFIDNQPFVTEEDSLQITNDSPPTDKWFWQDCLFPQDGFYGVITTLRAPSGTPVSFEGSLTLKIKGMHQYIWGSEMTPGNITG